MQKLETEEIDIVLMDVQMPIMSGEEATACIREQERGSGRHLPIVAMTAHAMKGDRERLLRAGMDDYLAKPIQSAELMRILEKYAPAEPVTAGDVATLDRQAALACMGGDANILADIAALFLEDYPKILGEIQEAVAAKNADVLYRSAHSLKGSLGYLGARAAETQAKRLESFGRAGELEDAPKVLAELEKQLTRLRPAVAELASAMVNS